MFYHLQIPDAVPDVDEVRVLEWHGRPGHTFAPGELMVEVETHKAVVEVRAERAVTLRDILCAEGDWQKVGVPLALVSEIADEALPESSAGVTALDVAFEVN
jgi:pyruvate/2-oxoglutarate dehydrogenase complex dihydrolipoamide acyltransferase (E2) component